MRNSKFVDVVLYLTLFGSAIYLLSNLPAAKAGQSKVDRANARCVELADYSKDVAEMRDMGISLAAVKETNAEQYRANILEAHDIAAEITYRNRALVPAKIREGMLTGCLGAVADEAKRRSN